MLENKTWMTVQEVAESLGVSTGRVRQYLMNGQLSGKKFGNTWAIATAEFKKFAKLDRKPGNPNFPAKSG